jgi:dipeptidyl aminopeptidase/acylaminoacyl peptidase
MHGGPLVPGKIIGAIAGTINYWQRRVCYVMTDYTGSTGYGEKFTQDIQFDPLKGPAMKSMKAQKKPLKSLHL